MSAARKGFYYRRLRDAGVQMDRHFREYTEAELLDAHAMAVEKGIIGEPTEEELSELEQAVHKGKQRKPRQAQPEAPVPPAAPVVTENAAALPDAPALPPRSQVPLRPADPNEMPGQRMNTKGAEDPIRVDEQGRIWLQEEVKKPAYPKPRGRRVLRYMETGVEKQTVKLGDYTETFEVAGDPKNATPAEIKITLPSYQVGIFRDPRFPFKVITYNGNEGFDRDEVNAFYGGSELVPPSVKRKYVENVLCYDIRSVIRAVQDEYRRLQLTSPNA